MQTKSSLIALNLVPGLGSATIHRLLSSFDAPEGVFKASPLILKQILGRWANGGVIERLLEADHPQAVAEELNRANEAKVQVVTLFEGSYPQVLKTIPDPPPVLYLKGSYLKEDEASVAIVGTRSATPYGLKVATELAQDLARTGLTIVSGLAEGIDGAAHRGALSARGRTMAVLGHGLSHIYPAIHGKLAQEIVHSGCLISEFPMDFKPRREHFPRRNRLISGLSLGVVVVEAPQGSGALITAREALEQGREVFAVPGPVSNVKSRGTHQLLKEGAKLVEDAQDVLEELAPQLKDRLESFRETGPSPLPALSERESAVYGAIPVGAGLPVESILQATTLSPPEVLGVLTSLELKGLVRQIPGQGYSRT